MALATFDALAYFEKLKAAGVPEEQARIQAEALKAALDGQDVSRDYLDAKMKELELRLLKWQLGIGLALAAIMAKGFGWIGF